MTASLTMMTSMVTTTVRKKEGSLVSLATPTPPTSVDNKASGCYVCCFFFRSTLHEKCNSKMMHIVCHDVIPWALACSTVYRKWGPLRLKI